MSNLLWRTTDVWTAKLVLSALVTYLAQYEACSTNTAVQLSQYVASFWRGCTQMNSDAALKKSNIYPAAPESKKPCFSSFKITKLYGWTHRHTQTQLSNIHLKGNRKNVWEDELSDSFIYLQFTRIVLWIISFTSRCKRFFWFSVYPHNFLGSFGYKKIIFFWLKVQKSYLAFIQFYVETTRR